MPAAPAPAPPDLPGGRSAGLALAFAIAAALACWNPFAAPLGLAVGIAAALLALRAWRRRAGRKAVAVAALGLALLAAAVSAAELLLTAGAMTTELPGEPIVRGRSDAEAAALLEEARKRTATSRQRAQRELEKGTGSRVPAAAPGGTVRDDGGLAPAPRGPDDGARNETE